MPEQKKLRVIFVAGLSRMKDGGTGGQTAEALLLQKGLNEYGFELITVETQFPSVIVESLFARTRYAAQRLWKFCTLLPTADLAWIYVADGLSMVEKGLMCMLARVCGLGVVLRPLSGYLTWQSENWAWMRIWLRWVMRSCHVVLAQGQTWKEFFIAHGATTEKIVVMPNPVVIQSARNRKRVPGEPLRILYVGWLIRLKGIFEMAEVFRRVREKFSNAELRIAGSGTEREELEQVFRESGVADSVHMLGWQSNEQVHQELLSADVFLFASHAEGMPNAVLEALAHGVPVVATRVGALPELIETGKNGYLTDVGDVAALTEATIHHLENETEAEEIGELGRQTVERQHEYSKIWHVNLEALLQAARESAHNTDGILP